MKIPWRRKWQPIPIFLPGEFHGRGALWAKVHGVAKGWTRLSDIYFCFIDYSEAFDCVDHKKTVENSERDGNTRPPDLPPEKSVGKSRRNSWNWTGKNRLVPKWERSTSRLCIVTLLI